MNGNYKIYKKIYDRNLKIIKKQKNKLKNKSKKDSIIHF